MSKKIFIFPYAGGTTLNFFSWKKYINKYQIYFLEYAGHGMRVNERFNKSIDDIANDMATIIMEKINLNDEVRLFGHSLGGIVAWHTLEKLIEKYHVYPKDIYISACSTPMNFAKSPHFEFKTEEELKQSILGKSEDKKHIFDSKYFKNNILPAIINDYKLIKEYKSTKNIKVKIPIYSFIGEEDEYVSEEEIQNWKKLTICEYKNIKFMGNHFYFNIEANKEKICRILDE